LEWSIHKFRNSKDHQQSPEAPRGREESFLEVSEVHGPTNNLISDF
jgi:hypothetical protein